MKVSQFDFYAFERFYLWCKKVFGESYTVDSNRFRDTHADNVVIADVNEKGFLFIEIDNPWTGQESFRSRTDIPTPEEILIPIHVMCSDDKECIKTIEVPQKHFDNQRFAEALNFILMSRFSKRCAEDDYGKEFYSWAQDVIESSGILDYEAKKQDV